MTMKRAMELSLGDGSEPAPRIRYFWVEDELEVLTHDDNHSLSNTELGFEAGCSLKYHAHSGFGRTTENILGFAQVDGWESDG
jgi:hypothetical protein